METKTILQRLFKALLVLLALPPLVSRISILTSHLAIFQWDFKIYYFDAKA